MAASRQILLEFKPAHGRRKHLRDGLSALERIGDTLWLANDETLSLERLTLKCDGSRGVEHVTYPLADYLDLPAAPTSERWEEADLEGLAHAEGYLWLVGSHSLKRKLPRTEDGAKKGARRLASLACDGNRYLLARIPLARDGSSWRPAKLDGERHAARLAGDARGDALTLALADDAHLAPFLSIPGKDNGFDVEGLASVEERIFLGLRGPVLRGWALILELEPRAESRESLGLRTFAGERRPYLKHFLQLGGLGVRDLCRWGDDLLILAGPTQDLDGPVRVLCWRGGAVPHKKGEMVNLDRLETLLDIPHGRGVDHAEGMTLLGSREERGESLLVVYDAAAEQRKYGAHGVFADVFTLTAS